MSFWGKKGRNAPNIRIEKVAAPAPSPPASLKNAIAAGHSKPRIATDLAASRRTEGSLTPKSDSRASTPLDSRKKIDSRKRSPAFQRVESDSEDDGSLVRFDSISSKKVKTVAVVTADIHRNLRSLQAFSQDDADVLIHAADIACTRYKFPPAFSASAADVCVELQYPGTAEPERYELVYRKEDFNPIREIMKVVRDFTNFFLTAKQAEPFLDAESGIIRRLERATSRNVQSLEGFKSALKAYNTALSALRREGALAKNIDEKHSIPVELVKRIVRQTYDRAVSPKVDLLRKYENGTDFIYGELKRRFVFTILAELKITSDQVFVDLGSGVANVVLQAALQVGCESWGCEIMENACTLAEAQRVEFEARCRLWGLAPGAVKLERGDFMTNINIREALKRADIVLVNNEVFTPELNNDLVNLFLDLKDGCKIVSLKSFVPHNHKITSYNLNNPVNLLDVVEKTYSSKSVSWKGEGGQYFVATKDSKRLKSYSHLG